MTVRLRGDVSLGPETGSLSGAVLRIYLEDVSKADAAAEVVGEVTITGLVHRTGRHSSWPFELQVGSIDPAKHYAVRAHVDCHGDRGIHSGDCVSTRSYPVLTFGNSDRVAIDVRQIG